MAANLFPRLERCKRSWVYKHGRTNGPITKQLGFQVWLSSDVFSAVSSKNLIQSAGGHSSEPMTFRIFRAITLWKVTPAAWKLNIKSSYQFSVDHSMCTHRFRGILAKIWLVTGWKIDSPIFFHVQGVAPTPPDKFSERFQTAPSFFERLPHVCLFQLIWPYSF